MTFCTRVRFHNAQANNNGFFNYQIFLDKDGLIRLHENVSKPRVLLPVNEMIHVTCFDSTKSSK